ncbi:MAG: penicillin-binding protein activator [Gemmatimonadota bacterium]|nr:penicillin-binding protein activator [Gemmatimonadota bacterium]
MVAFLAVTGACASMGSRTSSGETASVGIDTDAAVAALQAAQALYEAGDYEGAVTAADSLSSAWSEVESVAALAERALNLGARSSEAAGLLGPAGDRYARLLARNPDATVRREAVERYASILSRTGRQAEAVEIAVENAGLLDEAGLDDLRQWAGALTREELSGIRESHGARSREGQIVYIHLAELLAAGGQLNAARRVAREVVDAGAEEPERSTAELLLSLEDDVSVRTARIGAILPLSGELASVGQLLREGMELALEAYERDRPDGFEIELLIRDDASNPETTAGLVVELERAGAVAIIGPLRSESLAAAARARQSQRLSIVSPTATEVLGPAPNVYTLYDLGRRERDVATDLARWAVEELGLRRAGVLRPGDPALARAATLFGRAFEQAGGAVIATASYTTVGTTTFQDPIRSLASSSPDIVFAPAASASAVLTLAPQLVYYGLDRSIIMGSEAWAEPGVLRRLESFAADYRVVGLWADRVSPGTPWQAFVRAYERKYRKSLRDNVVPALSHDAVGLVIAALEEARLPIPAAVASRLADGMEFEGVTGTMHPDPETSTVRRRTQIRMLVDRALHPPDRNALLRWLAAARAAPASNHRDDR